VDKASVERLARLAEGSLGLARALNEQGLWSFRNSLFEALIKTSPDTPALASRLKTLYEEAGKEAGIQRPRAALVVRLLIDGLRQSLSISVDGGASADPADEKLLRQLAEKIGPDGLLKRLDRCLEADVRIDRKVQLSLVMEALVDALASP
jgi:DNA polymerase III subunit delta'